MVQVGREVVDADGVDLGDGLGSCCTGRDQGAYPQILHDGGIAQAGVLIAQRILFGRETGRATGLITADRQTISRTDAIFRKG